MTRSNVERDIPVLAIVAWRMLGPTWSQHRHHKKAGPRKPRSCSDWGANAILRFDPKTERFESLPLPDSYASVRQLAGRKGEVWGAESAAGKLIMIKTE